MLLLPILAELAASVPPPGIVPGESVAPALTVTFPTLPPPLNWPPLTETLPATAKEPFTSSVPAVMEVPPL